MSGMEIFALVALGCFVEAFMDFFSCFKKWQKWIIRALTALVSILFLGEGK